MMKDLYDLLSEIDMDVVDIEPVEVSEFERENGKRKLMNSIKSDKRKRTSKYLRKSLIGLAASICIIVIFTNTNLGAMALEKIHEILFVDFDKVENVVKEDGAKVMASDSKNGYTIQLENILLDKEEFVINWKMVSDEPIMDGVTPMPGQSKIYVNDKLVTEYNAGDSKKCDEHTMKYRFFHGFDDSVDRNIFNGELNIRIVWDQVYNLPDEGHNITDPNFKEEVTGPWEFNFKVNAEDIKLKEDSKEISGEFKLDNDTKFELERYVTSQMETRIEAKTINSANINVFENKFYDVRLRGKDDTGNNVEFYLSGYSNDFATFVVDANDYDKVKNAKYLKLTPYGAVTEGDLSVNEEDLKKLGDEFTIDLLK